jgi:hypothetical protein
MVNEKRIVDLLAPGPWDVRAGSRSDRMRMVVVLAGAEALRSL